MLKIRYLEEKPYVDTNELYKFLRLATCKYSEWCSTNIVKKGVSGTDYIDCSDKVHSISSKGRSRMKFKILISIDFAIAITFRYDTYLAKTLRRDLISIRNSTKR